MLTAQPPTCTPASFMEAPGKRGGLGRGYPGHPMGHPEEPPKIFLVPGVCSHGVSRRVLGCCRRTARTEAEQQRGRMKPPDRVLCQTPLRSADLVSGTGCSNGSDPAARPRGFASLITVYQRVAAAPAGRSRPGGGWRREGRAAGGWRNPAWERLRARERGGAGAPPAAGTPGCRGSGAA